MRSRKRLLLTTTSFFLAALAAAQIAEAAPPAPSPRSGPAQSSSQFTLRREEAGGPDAAVARSRARAGDCAGALPAFDSAIRLTIEPTLHRDRGLCHEKVGNPYPAIDDYRFYLTSRPDAPDADQIRDRLSRLEESVGIGGPSAQSIRDRDEDAKAGAAAGATFADSSETGASGSYTASSNPKKSARADETLGPRNGQEGRSYDYYAAQERLADQADSSPLRFGTGWAVGPLLMLPRYFVGTGVSKDLGYAVGAAIRYSFGPTLSFITELGYSGVGDSGSNTSLSGPLVFAGLEARIPLDKWASNQLLLGIGPGFERYTVSGTQVGVDLIEARARFGYRHIFGPAVGLELTVDGGPVYYKPTGIDADGKTYGLIGVSYALIIGF
jgi:hypothetical protein